MYAHIFGSKSTGFKLYSTQGAELVDEKGHGTYVSKAEAKRIACQLGLIPWNY
jgi:hypothetical protein